MQPAWKDRCEKVVRCSPDRLREPFRSDLEFHGTRGHRVHQGAEPPIASGRTIGSIIPTPKVLVLRRIDGSPGGAAVGASPMEQRDSGISQTKVAGALKNAKPHTNLVRQDEAAREVPEQPLASQEGENPLTSSPDQANRDALFREFVLWELLHMDAER